jgi:AraC-like DNA-binding protein
MPCHEEIEGHFREGLSLIAFHFALEAFLGYDVFMGTTDLRQLERQRQVTDDLARCAGRTLELAEIVRLRGLVHVMAAQFIDRSVDDLRRLVDLRGRYRPIFDELESKDGAKATVARLAVVMGMRRERLSRAFARDMQLPLKSYLIRHLASRACEYLAASEDPIGAISRSLAFSSEGYFCRFFRRHTGMTPLRYRRMRQRWQGSG